MRFLIIHILLLLHLKCTLAYSSAPGTCSINKMGIFGHGPSKSTCPDCYGVKISTDSSSLVNIHITGRYSYQGIVFLIKDKSTNKTVGEFKNFNEELLVSVACDDDEPEDQVDFDSNAVLGHIDSKWKEWPINVDWSIEATKPLTELKFQAIVVIDYDNFHVIPETHFKIKRKVINQATIEKAFTTTTTTSSLSDTAKSTQTIIEVEHTSGTIVQQETNTLFLYVLSFFILIYFVLSICYRQLFKKRSARKRNFSFSSVHQPEDISLVVTSK